MAGSAKSSTNSRGIKNGGTEVLRCSCVNEYQDKKYGKQMRVHNVGTKGSKCTVCLSMR